MFKKLFFGWLALLLTLGLAFQAGPALAMSPGGDMVVDPTPPVLAQIKSVVLLERYPPQLKITGTLPSDCYQLRVAIPPIGDDPQPNLSASPVTIWVRGVYLRGSVCTQAIKAFTTTVTLDPVKYNLPPGKYVAMINPQNGKSLFKSEFYIRPPYIGPIPVTITQMLVMESYPPRFQLTGTVQANCYQVSVSAPKVNGKIISVVLQAVLPPTLLYCYPGNTFTKTVTIDPAKLGLAPGTYTILFNPNSMGESRFKSTLTVR